MYGTINCDGINAKGEICGVTTTSGLFFKIPGRVGDSPILGAGLYVDGSVGAAGSTGRGEANLYNLSSYLIVENMRRGMHPKDAGLEALKRIKANTVEKRLRKANGDPNFNINFYVLNAKGEYAGVAMYAEDQDEQRLGGRDRTSACATPSATRRGRARSRSRGCCPGRPRASSAWPGRAATSRPGRYSFGIGFPSSRRSRWRWRSTSACRPRRARSS